MNHNLYEFFFLNGEGEAVGVYATNPREARWRYRREYGVDPGPRVEKK